MTTKAGSKASGRRGAGAVAESLCPDLQVGGRKKKKTGNCLGF